MFDTPPLPRSCVSYLSGAIVSVLLLLTLVDENMLLHIRIADRNLLWYIAVFSGAFAVSRSVVPDPQDTVLNPAGAMKLVRR